MSTSHPLPSDLLESQISTLDLLLAMFPDENEFGISQLDLDLITNVRDNGSENITSTPSEINLSLHIHLDPTHSIQVNITAPLRTTESDPSEAPPLTFSLRQPTWLDKAALATLTSTLPEDIFSALDHLRDEAPSLLPTYTPTTEDPVSSDPLVRVWFYFPSLSTREKRLHMVLWAPSYSLTGFVLAGKPGLLCLEGTSPSISAYMNEIKTVSWSDIPPHQKKVTERYREEGDEVKRAFEDMSEITAMVGEKHGARQNRGDMAAIENWLKVKGLGHMFESVILQS
ncbi:hypothetical protein AUEXF2481DRAFT_4947 [Aureobasidium subglaciale EXF-2481]|uniref:Small nuclear ribonucleoprotein Prp3 C-terminal domain-containing protein n=1 Tax=Aureobasidium subglaciale (strain EXF-2481) TaxID=1043005 RepID=A0A074Z923_AURSE|nr:uncharacterized protein AUEXF2481DRAFT_4947 [Aureobasidium subglaciale EXF-2481]KAI5204997.1 hypothetical protein E4T38_04553 [Aureobasidium subglaciale]KAI5223849.1 hypothetical protein E4T40_04329 [Aureobasidium subglaciale]KAI5227407.1 hypothetical protein E4T41_04411 [Aureobasidium subglaciale]KAI5262722.1 hypothetical protein E4T46_04297 [Aureobasidium subglaciale]KEQ95331.1 hypothetical protein AUEXF2481DRAFT_4947 [Aureobasidium subglaciale EXF-2481]